ncbi:GNAT family N-acetyltransferase [Roseovarius dicentrarchi]|uniref:GNAT family N-acetyltransferase n=1 Tax=Roseovarius dicentrarchi TaxID=2250573 RepID=UPI001EF0021C|nr:GNAT family N-acetyltransferase [Roseovarius dicentrarchi]
MTALTLAKPGDLDTILPLIAAFHSEAGVMQDDDALRAAVAPLLDGSPHGAIYMAGPVRAPIGYAVISFGWSLQFGGLEGKLAEIYIRPGVRGRGIASDILSTLPRALAGAGLRVLHLETARDDARPRAFYERMHFTAREDIIVMSRKL